MLMSQWESRLRLLAVRIVILGAFFVLGLKLWQLQIVQGQTYQQQADRQRFSVETIDAPRGVFYDRNGTLLVRNVPGYTVTVTWSRLPEDPAALQALLDRLSSLLGLPASAPSITPTPPSADPRSQDVVTAPQVTDLKHRIQNAKARPYEPYSIVDHVDRERAFMIMQDLPQLPGVQVQVEPTREYVDGPLFSHILGYMWRMSAEEAPKYLNQPNSDYTANDVVGNMGLEKAMESDLRGIRGRRHVEVDAYGRVVEVLGVEDPQPGNSVVLTLDRDLQASVEQILQKGIADAKGKSGVAIVMNPNTGELLSMVSLPTYDNNVFAQGLVDDYTKLLVDPSQPMFNRAIGGQYPPGSIFKIIPASAGLQEGIINASTTFNCTATMYLDPGTGTRWPFYCWIRDYGYGHGPVNVVTALEQSCDIFFYQLGGGWEKFPGLGLDTLAQYCKLFGLGEATGIGLPGEEAGLVPSSKYKRLNYKESWTTGDTYNASIGQGYDLVTPLQMVNALSVIANGGTLYKPQVVREVVDANGKIVKPFQPQVIRKLDLSQNTLATVRQGLRMVVNGPAGTARMLEMPEVAIAGKTGSAEYGLPDATGKKLTHAWFIGYAPAEKPEIAIVVFIEDGVSGSGVAAPIGGQIIRSYFGLPATASEAAHLNDR
jgi:penicillin-binding protein 2